MSSSSAWNGLANEQSPYLLQHARNPVHWFPWGEKAFQKATEKDLPIFLSVGYSSCHWCHVMERESFENDAIAKVLNENFVSIKVDREERPDIDQTYMTFVQATTGSGGWPMSVFLTPDLKPFFGGTYFAPDNRFGQLSFMEVLNQVSTLWREKRGMLNIRSTQIVDALAKHFVGTRCDGILCQIELDEINKKYFHELESSFDSKLGGFGSAPKFPGVSEMSFLFSLESCSSAASFRAKAASMALLTLRRMAAGGIHDHIAGGFSRYSVDAFWHIPHFEKMLYVNAQLIEAYLSAFVVEKDPFYAEVAIGIVEYVLRDMKHSQGAFFSAEDADSLPSIEAQEKLEGAFYVWKKSEIDEVLGERESEIFCTHFYCKDPSNVDLSPLSDPRGEFRSVNVPIELSPPQLEATASRLHLSRSDVLRVLLRSVRKLFQARSTRPRPFRDDKVVTAWNGMMISALCKCVCVLEGLDLDFQSKASERSVSLPGYAVTNVKSVKELVGDYKAAGLACADFIEKNLTTKTSRLLRCFRTSNSGVEGFAEDYAQMVKANLDLYDITFDFRYINRALELQNIQDELFYDEEAGGYFTSASKDSPILFRMKNGQDGADSSVTSVAVSNLLRLGRLKDDNVLLEKAMRCVTSEKATLHQNPAVLPALIASANYLFASPRMFVVCGRLEDEILQAMIFAIRSQTLATGRILLVFSNEKDEQYFGTLNVAFASMKPQNQKATAYICEGFSCQSPVHSVEDLIEKIASIPSNTSCPATF